MDLYFLLNKKAFYFRISKGKALATALTDIFIIGIYVTFGLIEMKVKCC